MFKRIKTLFHSKYRLLKRIESLEEALGVHYTVDGDGYAEHLIRGSESSYHVLSNLVKDVKELTDKKGKK